MAGNKHSQRLTAAALLDAQRPDMFITAITLVGHATLPGTFSIRYDGIAQAHFPVAGGGFVRYEVNHKLVGQTIPAGSVAFNGNVAAVVVEYSDAVNAAGKSLATYRAIRFARTDAGATTADVEVDFDAGSSIPKWVIVQQSASAGRVLFPATVPTQLTVEACVEEFNPPLVECPGIPAAQSLTLSVVTDGAATIQAVVYY